MSFSDVVLWPQYYKRSHSTAEFNFCLSKAGDCPWFFFSAVRSHIVVERRINPHETKNGSRSLFLKTLWAEVNFSGSDQALKNIWLKISIAFVFLLTVVIIWIKTKYLHSPFEYLLVGNQLRSLFNSFMFMRYYLFFVDMNTTSEMMGIIALLLLVMGRGLIV